MKTLTLYQPYATLVALGVKLIETRSWGIKYRGRLAIHASKRFPEVCQEHCFSEPFRSILYAAGYIYTGRPFVYKGEFNGKLGDKAFPLGCVLAHVRLLDCVRITGESIAHRIYGREIVIPPDNFEKAMGDYTPGRWAWIIDDVQPFSEPIPAKGSLGLWDWDMSEPL